MNKIIKNISEKIQMILKNKLVKQFLNFKKNITQTIIELKSKNFSFSGYKKFSLSYLTVFLFLTFIITGEKEDPAKLKVSTVFAEYLVANSNYELYNKVDGKKKDYQFINKDIYQKCISNMEAGGCNGFDKTIGKSYAQNFSFDAVDTDKDGRASIWEIRNRFYHQESDKINNKKFKWDYKLIDEALESQNLQKKVDAYMSYLKANYTTRKHTKFGMETTKRVEKDLDGDFVVSKQDLKKYFIIYDSVFESFNFKNGEPNRAKIAKRWRRSAKYWNKSASEVKRKSRRASNNNRRSTGSSEKTAMVKGRPMPCSMVAQFAEVNANMCFKGATGQCSHAQYLRNVYNGQCR
ncbi:hypothetical protein N9317_02065 [Pelagibacteraceae bacterium]|nr:hypothetical protein [Pelagibacteraceae bacterium]